MSRSLLVLFCLALLLVLLPLAVPRPGMPPTLKADEPAYLLMALSLVEDGDLRCQTKDLRRLFDAYPHLPVENVILMSDDDWQTAYFGKPYIYSLLAAPAAALLGGRGMVCFNMLLLMAMVGLGLRYLRRWNDESTSALFAAGFFLVSPAFAYVFWLQPEILILFSVTTSLYLGLTEPTASSGEVYGWRNWKLVLFGGAARPWWSAAALSIAVYNKPMLAAFGLPILWSLWRRRGWKSAAAWSVAAILSMATITWGSLTLSGAPSAYLGTARAGIKVNDPERLTELLEPLRGRSARAIAEENQSLNSYAWLIRIPKLFPRLLKENVGYFLWGRHTGVLLYMPFAVLALIFFLAHGRRSIDRWLLFAATAGIALFFLIWIHYNWHGGSGFVGNRYFITAYPAFLFLVTRVRPVTLVAAGFLSGGLFLAPILFAPYGAAVPDPTLQFHTRGAAFERFPVELSMRTQIPGYETVHAHGVTFRGRSDLIEAERGGPGFAVRGAVSAEVWATSARALDSMMFEVGSLAPENAVTFELEGEQETVTFPLPKGDPGSQALLELSPRRESKIWFQYGKKTHGYRLLISPRTGRNPRRADGEFVQPQFYLGADVEYLGTRSELERKANHRVKWGTVELAEQIAAGDVLEVRTTVRNTGEEAWRATGALAVSVAHRWLDRTGGLVATGKSTPLARPIRPGASSGIGFFARAPEQEGAYILEVDLEREGLARFSERGGAKLQIDVDVQLSVAP